MTALLPGLLIAAAASLALNSSYLIQHGALVDTPAIRLRRPVATVRGLMRSRRWITGAVLGYAGLALNITALALAPLALVETVIAAGLVVVAFGAARLHGEAPRRREWAAPAMMTVAVAALSIGQAPGVVRTGPSVTSTLVFGFAAIAAGVLVAMIPSKIVPAPVRLGLAAGCFYGATTLALGVMTAGAGVGTTGAGFAVALATLPGGFFTFQRGLQSGPAMPVVTMMTAGTNVIALVGAASVLGERLGASDGLVVLHAVGFALVPVAAALAAAGLVREAARAGT